MHWSGTAEVAVAVAAEAQLGSSALALLLQPASGSAQLAQVSSLSRSWAKAKGRDGVEVRSETTGAAKSIGRTAHSRKAHADGLSKVYIENQKQKNMRQNSDWMG